MADLQSPKAVSYTHLTAPYKYPRLVEYVDALPKTVNGKIRRAAIRESDEAAKAPEGLV